MTGLIKEREREATPPRVTSSFCIVLCQICIYSAVFSLSFFMDQPVSKQSHPSLVKGCPWTAFQSLVKYDYAFYIKVV